MAELPWRSQSPAMPERDYLALLSYLPLASGRHLPLLLLHMTRIRRQLRTSAGLIGYSLRAEFAGMQFWTLSVWEDEAALQAFVMASPHAGAVQAMAPHMGVTRFTRWTVQGADLPLRWDEALARDDPGSANSASASEPPRA
jgi:quinol monooxygenase YgiN